jgi:hypothetical protein
MSSEPEETKAHEATKEDKDAQLHIFVNRRKFERGDGVKEVMTGAEIAALVSVPPENAVIRRDSGSDKSEIGINEKVKIKNGDHFLVTRKVVEGGHVA